MTRENSSRLSRRKLLAGLGFGVAAVGAIATPALKLGWTRKADRPFTSLSRAGVGDWSRQVGARFVVAGGIAVTLAEVVPMPSAGRRPAGLREGAFALVFKAAGATLPAGEAIYEVSHATAGRMKIFFSTCQDRCGGRRLLAIFN